MLKRNLILMVASQGAHAAVVRLELTTPIAGTEVQEATTVPSGSEFPPLSPKKPVSKAKTKAVQSPTNLAFLAGLEPCGSPDRSTIAPTSEPSCTPLATPLHTFQDPPSESDSGSGGLLDSAPFECLDPASTLRDSTPEEEEQRWRIVGLRLAAVFRAEVNDYYYMPDSPPRSSTTPASAETASPSKTPKPPPPSYSQLKAKLPAQFSLLEKTYPDLEERYEQLGARGQRVIVDYVELEAEKWVDKDKKSVTVEQSAGRMSKMLGMMEKRRREDTEGCVVL